MSERIVIIGAGQAGAQAVATLRAEGFAGALTMVGDEAYAPYQRPPLSKAYLAGTFDRERLFLKPDAFYAEAKCETDPWRRRRRHRPRRENRGARRRAHAFATTSCCIATGSRVRQIRVPGADLDGVHYLRSIADVDRLRPAFKTGKSLAIVGGGYIGLEVAAVARKYGLDVTVFEALDRVMARAVSPVVSDFYEGVHREAGVDIPAQHRRRSVRGHQASSKRSAPAGLASRRSGAGRHRHRAQFRDWREQAGLTCGDGIVVDKFCATDDPAIFAAGDCTRHHGRDGNQIRLECVQNAIDQAKHAALAMAGKPTPYSEVPWFWSDQYDLKLQIAGLAAPGDPLVVRGDPAPRKFAVFHLRGGQVAAVEAVNAAPEYIVGRKLIAEAGATVRAGDGLRTPPFP